MAVSFSAQQSFGQQEVDPDHFDQPAATKVAKAPTHKNTASHVSHHKTQLANKHAKQHRAHPTA